MKIEKTTLPSGKPAYSVYMSEEEGLMMFEVMRQVMIKEHTMNHRMFATDYVTRSVSSADRYYDKVTKNK